MVMADVEKTFREMANSQSGGTDIPYSIILCHQIYIGLARIFL